MHRTMLFVLAASAASNALAQASARPDATAPSAKVPPFEYRSAFAGYRGFTEEQVAPWRESNEAVKAGPGHAGNEPNASRSTKPPAKPAGDGGHGDHK